MNSVKDLTFNLSNPKLPQLPPLPNYSSFKEKILSKTWRLNNLYYIRDKEANLRLLQLNTAQQYIHYLEQYYNRLLILKSRQRGVSTYKVADQLDDCLFIDGITAGIQSYGKTESKKLRDKAILMWDLLDPDIKKLLDIQLVSANSELLEFSNGSSLRIGNFRGDTLQRFHVSELAKISAKFPEKAKEIKTGAFQAVSTNSKITVETTAEGQSGLFPDLWKEAVKLQNNNLKLTEMDFYPLFISWVSDPDASLNTIVPPSPQTIEYMKKYKDDINLLTNNNGLTQQQISWLSTQLRQLGDDFDREYPITPQAAFAHSIEGTYFAKQYTILVQENRIQDFPHLPSYPVYTSWDIGWNDELVILFWQVIAGKVFLIDEYHNTGEGFKTYIDVLNSKPYEYKRHFMPFDINMGEVGTGRTRYETLLKLGMRNMVVVDKISFPESIQVARNMLLSDFYISATAKDTITAIQSYRKKKDEKRDVYLDTDVHDIHSNYMAAFRYGALGLSQSLVKLTTVDTRDEDLQKTTSNQSLDVAL